MFKVLKIWLELFVDIEKTEVLEVVMLGNDVLSLQDVEESVNNETDPKRRMKRAKIIPKSNFIHLMGSRL